MFLNAHCSVIHEEGQVMTFGEKNRSSKAIYVLSFFFQVKNPILRTETALSRKFRRKVG